MGLPYKYHPDGTVDRFKAWLVAKGYNQIEGIDYNESFSPVAKAVTIRMFFAIVSAKQWPLHQLDINNAYFHCFVDEDLYMTPPAGYLNAKEGHVSLSNPFIDWNKLVANGINVSPANLSTLDLFNLLLITACLLRKILLLFRLY